MSLNCLYLVPFNCVILIFDMLILTVYFFLLYILFINERKDQFKKPKGNKNAQILLIKPVFPRTLIKQL